MKKYSDKYLNNYKTLCKAIIGFEFECYFNTSFYKTLENLNHDLNPVNVHGFRVYHSSFKPDANNFKLERDLSGGENLAEIVTGPLDYYSAKYYLVKILRFIDKFGYTNEKCSLHLNISYKDTDLNELNILKQILSTDEDYIYHKFPSRKNNIYAKSVKTMIPFKDYDYSNVGINTIKNSIQIPQSKYFGINFQNISEYKEQRLEFRYIGGENYQKQTSDIIEIMDQMIVNTWNNIGTSFTDKNVNELSEFLDDRISSFKNLSEYDSFLVEYPTVEIQIDQDSRYEVVSSHYPKLYEKIYKLIESVSELGDAIINYHTETNKIEVIGANFESILDLSGYDFIDCEIYRGIFNNSNIVNCKIINAEINRSTLDNCDISEGRLVNCNMQDGELKNSFFQSGLLNARMEGGVFRSGQLGPFATISPETTIVGSGRESFFRTNYGEEDDKKGKDSLNEFPK